jgi:hypothetical protein
MEYVEEDDHDHDDFDDDDDDDDDDDLNRVARCGHVGNDIKAASVLDTTTGASAAAPSWTAARGTRRPSLQRALRRRPSWSSRRSTSPEKPAVGKALMWVVPRVWL